MKAGNKRNGFVMLEVMIVIMIFTAAASVLLASASAMNRRAVKEIEKDRAYDTALAAVRLMADGVINSEEGTDSAVSLLTSGDGMDTRETYITVTPKDGSEPFSLPVTVWSKWDGDILALYAAAAEGGQMKTVSLTLQKQDPEYAAATPSSASDSEIWVPVRYDIGKEAGGQE